MTTIPLVVFDHHWLAQTSARTTNNSWVDEVLADVDGAGGLYLNTLRNWFHRFPVSKKQKRSLKVSLESYDNHTHLGAVNELSWWELMNLWGWSVQPVPTSTERRPDFYITQPSSFFCEVTTLNVSENERKAFSIGQGVPLGHKGPIERIVKKITNEKTGQILYGAPGFAPKVVLL